MSDEVTAIVPATRTALSFDEIVRLGSFIAKSGLFGMRTPEQAIALMMIAHAEGRHPALAARDYDIIQGRPTKKAEAMLRDFLDAGGKVKWHALTDEIADATFSHSQGGEARISWDMARAQKASLKGKDMYSKFPRQMLRSRCVSEGVRTIWPTATGGMYGPEEAVHIEATPELPEPTTRREQINAEIPMEPPKQPRMSWGGLIRSIDLATESATTGAEIEHVLTSPEVERAKQHVSSARIETRQAFEAAIAAAEQRQAQLADEGEADVPMDWEDPIAPLVAKLATMDIDGLNSLHTNAEWLSGLRDIHILPPDETRLREAVTKRKQELQGKQ